MDATMDLDGLALFVRVAEHQSFTQAARELGVPTSTVSRAVARLEDKLGVRLVQRTTRKVALTAEGVALVEGAKGPLMALASVAQAVGDGKGAPRGVLRVTAPTDLGPGLLAEGIAAFVARYPAVRLEMTLTNRTVDLVAEGLDVALRGGSTGGQGSLVARKLGTAPSRLFASPAYLARRGTPETVADLSEHDGVLYRGPRGIAKWLLDSGGETVEATPVRRVVGDDLGFVRAVVREGAGIGMIPAMFLEPDVQAGRLVRVLPAHERKMGDFFLVYPSARHVPAKLGAFRDFMVAWFQGHQRSGLI